MKANAAPEKLYLFEGEPILSARSKKVEGTYIEYTRTDAFIEKALAYLNEKFYFNNAFYGIVSTDFNAIEEMYEDFRNYMKGE